MPPGARVIFPLTRPVLTYGLLGVIVAVFCGQLVSAQLNDPRPEALTAFGALDFRSVLNGEYYRLLTSMFLHVNPAHLVFNGLALYYIGLTIESFFGRARFAIIYFLSGLCGSVASFLLTQGTSVGASGAIFGLFGAELVFLYQNRPILGKSGQERFRELILLALLNLGFGLFTQFAQTPVRIDNWGHIGGFAAGLALTWVIGPRLQADPKPVADNTYRLSDINALGRTWIAPVVFALGLILVMMYALTTLR